MSDIPVYYINLDTSVDRRAFITTQLARAGVTDAQRIPAFDGRHTRLEDAADCDLPKAHRYLGRPLRGGEYGCYRSHLDSLRRIAGADHDVAIVLEDDAEIDPDFMDVARLALKTLQDRALDWDVVHLGANRMKISTRVARLETGHDLLHAHYFPMTTSALLWNRAGARDFLEHQAVITKPVDTHLREVMVSSGRGYAVWPAPVRQAGLDSDIDSEAAKRKVAGRTWYYGLVKQQRLWSCKLRALRRKYIG